MLQQYLLQQTTSDTERAMNEPLYLITGANGYTGSAAARELREQGHRVRGLVGNSMARQFHTIPATC
jgi:nucleoside-diphosphate-sugar epimerase